MSILNIHNNYIDKRINDIKKSKKWNSKIIDTSHEDFIQDYSSNVFTNLINSTFTKSYINKYKCSQCGEKATERCHGVGEERPLLIKKYLEKIWSDTTKSIKMKNIIIDFLEQHKYTKIWI
jgi:hypothetical protein